jgi:hypothetical protein
MGNIGITSFRSGWLWAVWLLAGVGAILRDIAAGPTAAPHDPLALSLASVSGLSVLRWCWVNRFALRRLRPRS